MNKILFVLLTVLLLAGCAKKNAIDAPPSITSPSVPTERMNGAEIPQTSEVRDKSVIEGTAEPAAVSSLLQSVYFDFDSYLLTEPARQILQGNARLLKSSNGARVLIEGHTDERGSDAYNLALGEKRAQAVRSYLVNLGIPAGQISTISYGEEKPAAQGNSEAAWNLNRRAEIVLRN